MFGVCVHPKYGGWFAIRALLVFEDVTVGSEMVQPAPCDCVPTREGRIQLLEAFNLHWQVQVLSTYNKYTRRSIYPLIQLDKVGFIKGRSLADNVCRLLHLIWLTRNSTEPMVASFLDAEKAFYCDECLFKALHKCGLHAPFINWVKLLDANLRATVLTKWEEVVKFSPF